MNKISFIGWVSLGFGDLTTEELFDYSLKHFTLYTTNTYIENPSGLSFSVLLHFLTIYPLCIVSPQTPRTLTCHCSDPTVARRA